MKSLKDILAKKRPGATRRIDEKSAESVFFEVFKKEFPSFERTDIRSFKLKDKKIFLRTVHPAIAGEIWRKRERMKQEINKLLGRETVEEVKVR